MHSKTLSSTLFSSGYKISFLQALLITFLLSGCGGSSDSDENTSAGSNADLVSITISTGILTPAFSSQTSNYNISVPNDISSITLTANTDDSNATAITNDSGTNSSTVALNVGSNNISIQVTAEDGTTSKTYTLMVTRETAALSTNANLSALSLSSASLDQAFQTSQLSYTSTVAFSIASMTVIATTDDTNATLSINSITTTSGSASGSIALSEGANTITIIVTAEDGTTSKSYSLDVTRQTAEVFAQQAFLKASNADGGANGGDTFGYAIALSGNRLVVGAHGEDSGSLSNQNDESSAQSGAVYVFVNNSGVWTQEAYLKPSKLLSTSYFGISVALSGDYIAVGANSEPTNGSGNYSIDHPNTGAVYIFKRSNDQWSQTAYLKAPNAERDDRFGGAVALDGDTLAVAANWEASATSINQADNSEPRAGAVYIYSRSGEIWGFEDYIKSSNASENDYFGTSVALSGDILAVGTIHEDGSINGDGTDNNLSSSGAVYVFNRSSGNWSQQAYLKAPNGVSFGKFGGALSLSGESLAIKGAGDDAAGNSNAAYAYIFTRTSGNWSLQAALKVHDTPGLEYNGGIAIDNNTLIVGRSAANDGGEATLYSRSGTSWTAERTFSGTNTEGSDTFGFSVAVSEDTLAVGAYREDSSANGGESDNSESNAGAAYIFK